MITRMPMARRPGLTLTEALVAMFVAALGMISLLTLFPLGALQMGQALKDSRTAEAARQADSLMRNYWRDAVDPSLSIDPNMLLWMNDPENGTTPNGSPRVTSGVSYPLFLDPIGENSSTGNVGRYWMTPKTIPPATVPLVISRPGLPRRNLGSGITNTFPQRLRFCTLLDDLTYDETGTGVPKLATPVERGGRYNWLAIVQRPENAAQNIANMTILVFDGRAPGYAIPNGELVCPVTIVPVAGAKVSSLTLTFSSLLPPVRPPVSKGRWIGLHTLISAPGGTPSTQTNILQFYRVVSANDETPGQLDIELQTPIRDDQVLLNANTTAIVFTGLSEVFERPQLNGK